jgi:hypothetical protein
MGMGHLLKSTAFSLCLQSVLSAQFKITYPSSSIASDALRYSKAKTVGSTLTGRVRLYFTRDNSTEPYYSCSDEQSTGQVFGIDAISWGPNSEIIIDDSVLGFPRSSLSDIEDGKLAPFLVMFYGVCFCIFFISVPFNFLFFSFFFTSHNDLYMHLLVLY